jgi:catechol 2,3-dioxygenase-like lactoylglutathione lyase family enzyme
MTASSSHASLGQVAVTVRDVAAAKTFYCGTLGLTPLFDAGPALSFVAAGTVRLMLTNSPGGSEPGRNSVLYFRLGPLDAIYNEVVSKGARGEQPPRLVATLPDHELWIAFVRDPDGNLIGLMEERPKL